MLHSQRKQVAVPADRWPYEPEVDDEREPFMMETSELGEKRIIEPRSSESGYGELDSARLRLCRMAGRGLANREPRSKAPAFKNQRHEQTRQHSRDSGADESFSSITGRSKYETGRYRRWRRAAPWIR